MTPRDTVRPRLVLVENQLVRQVFDIAPGEEFRVGRQPDCRIVIVHPTISREHARVFCDPTGVQVEDLQSGNGTWVNDSRIEGRVTLRHGDVVRLGQTKVDAPILLRFEDPASILLDALVDEDGAAIEPEKTLITVDEPAGEPMDAAAEAENTEDAQAATRSSSILRQRMVWMPIAAVLLVAVAIGTWLAVVERPMQSSWQSIRIDPVEVRAGWRMTLSGPSIQPSPTLRLWLDQAEAKLDVVAPGEIRFTAPDLGGEIGLRSVELRVESKDVVVFRQPVAYRTVPEVREASPREAAVGETIRIVGSGFTGDVQAVKLRIGEAEAPVVAANEAEIRVRVPIVTRGQVIDAPLVVRIGDWTSDAIPLRIRARDAACYRMPLTAVAAGSRVWELRQPLGAMFYLEGPAAPSGTVAEADAMPETFRAAIGAFDAAFAVARKDPSARFEVRQADGTPALVLVSRASPVGEAADRLSGGDSSPRPFKGERTVARWSPGALRFVKERTKFTGDPTLLPYWNALVLNQLLALLSKGELPEASSPAALRAGLERLRQRTIEMGGTGCPSDDDVSGLSAAERGAIEQAIWDVPRTFGVVSGSWRCRIENLPSLTGERVSHQLVMSLDQRGELVSGSANVDELRSEDQRWSPGPIEGLSGKLLLDSEVRIDLRFPPNRPFRLTRIAGRLEEEAIAATVATEDGRRESCKLVRGD